MAGKAWLHSWRQCCGVFRTNFISRVLLPNSYHDFVRIVTGIKHAHVSLEQDVAENKTCRRHIYLQSKVKTASKMKSFAPWKPLPLWTQDCMTRGSLMYLQQNINAGLGLQTHRSKGTNVPGQSPSVVGNFEGVAAHFHEEGGA